MRVEYLKALIVLLFVLLFVIGTIVGIRNVSRARKADAEHERQERLRAAAEAEKKREEEKRAASAAWLEEQRLAREARIARLKGVPLVKLDDGTFLFYPITVMGVAPVAGRKKVEEGCEDRQTAVLWANEMLEKGWPEVRLLARAKDGRDVEYARMASDGSGWHRIAD